MLLENLIPVLPADRLSTLIIVVAILGSILLIYSQFVELENRRDLVRITGSLALLSYALSIGNVIFIVTMLGIFIASLIEFIEIYTGYHHHTRDEVDIYKYIGKKRS